jgi:hypothetical protein
MNKKEAIVILDALAAGCSPFTGEVLEDHPILNDRQVVRALQVALDALSDTITPITNTKINTTGILDKETVEAAIALLKAANFNNTYSQLTKFFLGSRSFQASTVAESELYGLLKYKFTYNSLKPIVIQVLRDNPELVTSTATKKPQREEKPWDHIAYFKNEKFCKLSSKAITQLKEKIDALGIVKQPDTLSENIIKARTLFPRAYEPWSEKEIEYLGKAILYTNDLKILGFCFQRAGNSIEAVGKKLIFEGKAKIEVEVTQ